MIHYQGILIAACTFLIIGLFHPLVIKTEYKFGTKPWKIFLIVGIIILTITLFIENTIISALMGVLGTSLLWSIGELFHQKQRVKKGWFPMNPERKDEYTDKEKE